MNRIGDDPGRPLAYYLELARAANSCLWPQAHAGVEQPFANQVDAVAWLDAERPNLVAAVKRAASNGHDQAAMDLSILLAQYLYWRRRFDELLVTMSIGLSAARRLHDRTSEAIALSNLGAAVLAVGRLEASQAARQKPHPALFHSEPVSTRQAASS